MKIFKMKAMGEEGDDFRGKGESFLGYREKKIAEMKRENASRAIYNLVIINYN